jgi:hypothetical protein
MGHDISGFTRDGQRIEGPHFPRFWFPHYDMFDAWDHNGGVSGNGGSEPMTPERLQHARQACLKRLESSKQSVNEIEEEIRNTPPTPSFLEESPRSPSGRPKLFMIASGDSEQGEPKPQLIQMRDLLDSSDWDDEPTPPRERLRYARHEVRTFEELLDFIDRCLAEDVVRIEFW